MEIQITEVKSWIQRNKWILLALIGALIAGAAFFYVTHWPVASSAVQFPEAAAAADISAARIDEIIQDINRQRFREEEVVRNAQHKAMQAVADLDNDAIAAAWNSRLGEYRRRRDDQAITPGDDTN